MKNYEVALVLHPDLEIDQEATLKKIEAILTSFDAKITNTDNWGKRKLAYKIKKQDWGLYVFYVVTMDPANVRPLNDKLRISEEIMRYLIVSLEDIRYLKAQDPNAKKAPAKKS
jgi:small subunit ribosomal protein S6